MRLASILPGALLKHGAALLACPIAADHVVSRPLLRFGGAFDAHRFRDLTRLTPSWTDDERCGDCRQGERFHASHPYEWITAGSTSVGFTQQLCQLLFLGQADLALTHQQGGSVLCSPKRPACLAPAWRTGSGSPGRAHKERPRRRTATGMKKRAAFPGGASTDFGFQKGGWGWSLPTLLAGSLSCAGVIC